MTESVVDQQERLSRPAGIRSLQLGETRVSYLPDGVVQLRPLGWFPDTTEETWAAYPDYLDGSGSLVASLGALLVEHGERALLIDAGIGPQNLPAQPDGPVGAIQGGALLDSLATLGRTPEQIEAIAFTHLHIDHVGWVQHPVPGTDRFAFAHAEYLVSEPEWDRRDIVPDDLVTIMTPRVRTIADGAEIFPGVRVRVFGGHTPGHSEYVISGGGRRLIAFGDALHTSLQTDHPEWPAGIDHDPALAVEHRHRLARELAEPDTIGFGIHFADVQFGHVNRNGTGPAWQPSPVD
jgi:glyoxylase-like metal-dependent hydrolase (beta-lactamase superfamily II)